MNKKRTYEQPIGELIVFQSTDVVATSATGTGADPYLYDPYGDAWEETVV